MKTSPSHRGRPNADRAAEIDRALLAAALELFADAGYEATSMEAIAARAKVSKGTLYARYSGKEPLFRALLDREMRNWSERAGVKDHLLPLQVEARMRHHARTLIKVFGWPDFQRVTQLLDTVSTTFPDLVREWHQIGAVDYLDFLSRDLIIAAEAEGRLPQDWRLPASILLHTLANWYRGESVCGPVSEETAFAYADAVSSYLCGTP